MFGRLTARTKARELTKEEIGQVAGGSECEIRYMVCTATACQTVNGVTNCYDYDMEDIECVY